MNYPNEIIKHLFLGKENHSREFFHLIVNCTHEVPFSNFCNIRIRIPINDDIDDCSKLIQLLSQTNAIQKIHMCILSGQNVLVHCGENSSNQRSFAIIACYLIKYYKYTPIQTIHYIIEKIGSEMIDTENIRLRFMKSIIAYYYICKRT